MLDRNYSFYLDSEWDSQVIPYIITRRVFFVCVFSFFFFLNMDPVQQEAATFIHSKTKRKFLVVLISSCSSVGWFLFCFFN